MSADKVIPPPCKEIERAIELAKSRIVFCENNHTGVWTCDWRCGADRAFLASQATIEELRKEIDAYRKSV